MTKRDYPGNFELMIMLALIRLGDNAYGVPISEELEKGMTSDRPERAAERSQSSKLK